MAQNIQERNNIMSGVIHLAIYESDEFTLLIEYELIRDMIEIVNVALQARATSHFEQRERERRFQRLQNKNNDANPPGALEIAPSDSVWQMESLPGLSPEKRLIITYENATSRKEYRMPIHTMDVRAQ